MVVCEFNNVFMKNKQILLEIYYYLNRNRYLSMHTIKKGDVDQ